MAAEAVYYVNGRFVPVNEAFVSVRDLGILRGYGCFDYFRTYNGVPVTLTRNIQRLRNSCTIIGLELPWSDSELASIINQTLERNRSPSNTEYDVRVVATGGTSSSNIIPDGKPTLVVMVQPLKPLPTELVSRGCKVITVELPRLFPNAKTTNYIPAIIAQKRALKENALEAIYLLNNNVQEGTTSNVFMFFGNTLVTTPQQDILPGITRDIVIQLAKKNFSIEVRSVSKQEFLKADEVFLTAANKRIVPVVKVDDTTIGQGIPGRNTRVLMNLFDEFCFSNAKL